MDSCERWHRPDCSNPDIIIDGGAPRCLSCGASSATLVARLVEQNHGKTSNIHVPVAAPLGEANFWWPPCVTYRGPQLDMERASPATNDRAEPTQVSRTGPELSSTSPIYPSSLGSDHFRLICLAVSEKGSSPIHIQLEEYGFDDCPEYEAVSYLWGGEDGDFTICKPVYVGIFWDIILVTKNCSAVLHHLRPRRGLRIIWLDAICINQNDETEKPAQISRMCEIYSNCERVVAYMGDDLVLQPRGRTFRQRVGFQQSAFLSVKNPDAEEISNELLISCARSAGLSQDEFLQRRYLTRIWIVQELLLSKKAMFPLGDSNVICDGKQTVHVLFRADGEQLRISNSDGGSLSHLLKATAHCQASDPRDKIFGLLGLFKPQDSSQKLIPNYSLPWRDCWVGTCAYMLLVEGNFLLLAHAVGDNHSHLPSWVPDIDKAESWLLDLDETSIIPLFLESFIIIDNINLWQAHPSFDHTSGKRGSSDRASFGSNSSTEDHVNYINTSNSSCSTAATRSLGTDILMYSLGNTDFQQLSPQIGQPTLGSHRVVNHEPLYTLSMKAASIRSSDGALQLQAIRVFDGSCQLTVASERSELTSICVRGPSTTACIRVKSLKGHISLSESYQLFIISCQDLDSSKHDSRAFNVLLLALTTMHPGGDRSFVKLHDCGIIKDIQLYTRDYVEARLENTLSDTGKLHSLHWILHNLHEVVMSSYPVDSSSDWLLCCIFPSKTAKTREILQLMILLTEPHRREDASLDFAQALTAAAKNICPDFDPCVIGNHFQLTVKDRGTLLSLDSIWSPKFSRYFQERTTSRFGHRDEDWIVEAEHTSGEDPWTTLSGGISDMWQLIWATTTFPAKFRFPVKGLLSCMENTTPCAAMRCARRYSSLRHEDLQTFVHRSPRPEDRCVFAEGFGPSLVEELSLAWKLETITIA